MNATQGRPAGMPAGADAAGVPALIDAIATPAFSRAFFDYWHRAIPIDQCTAWRIVESSAPRQLVSERPGEQPKVDALCRAYAASLYHHDPVLGEAAGDDTLVRIVTPGEFGHPGYRRELFDEAGLAGKLVLRGVHRDAALYVSLYRKPRRRAFDDADLRVARSIHRSAFAALAAHARLRPAGPGGEHAVSRTLATALASFFASHPAALSPREASVCTRLALGDSMPAIAQRERVSLETVRTYRRRAFDKLGVARVTDLFALYLDPR